jgi:hypothetical protein
MLVNYRCAALMFEPLVPVFRIPALFVEWDPDLDLQLSLVRPDPDSRPYTDPDLEPRHYIVFLYRC